MKLLAPLALLACGCQAAPQAEDWTKFYEHQPTSILVLPVLNQTTAAEAPLILSSTITHPLVERGYYVFPVQPTLAILEANGIYEGGQLETVDPQKFREILGADALLYVTLESWDTNTDFFGTTIEVALDYRLVDAQTGEDLWKNSAQRVQQLGSGGSPLSMLVTAVMVSSMNTNSMFQRPLALQANAEALATLPPGPLRKDQASTRKALLARSKPVQAPPKP